MDAGAMLGILGVGFLIVTVVSLIGIVLTLICMWKVFEKMGEPGWAGIVPLYNMWKVVVYSFEENVVPIFLIFTGPTIISYFFRFLDLGALSSALRLASFAVSFYVFYNFFKSFGIEGGKLIAFTIFSPIGMIVLAFSNNYQYLGIGGEVGNYPVDPVFDRDTEYEESEYEESEYEESEYEESEYEESE